MKQLNGCCVTDKYMDTRLSRTVLRRQHNKLHVFIKLQLLFVNLKRFRNRT